MQELIPPHKLTVELTFKIFKFEKIKIKSYIKKNGVIQYISFCGYYWKRTLLRDDNEQHMQKCKTVIHYDQEDFLCPKTNFRM